MTSQDNTYIRETPESSNIKKGEYDKEAKTLTIYFKNGSTYRYSEVPESVWLAYKGTDSVGKFFYKHIKEQYDYKRI